MLSHQRPCCARMDKIGRWLCRFMSSMELLPWTYSHELPTWEVHTQGIFTRVRCLAIWPANQKNLQKQIFGRLSGTFALSLSFVSLGWKQMFLLVWHVLRCYLLRVRCVSCRRWGVRSSQHPHLESECWPLLCCCEGRERIFFVQCR